MTAHEVMEAARVLGAEALFTEAGAAGAEGPRPSYRNVRRAGFREWHVRPNRHTA